MGVYDHIYTDNYLSVSDINTHYIVMGFEFILDKKQSLKSDEQHSSLQWWPLEKLMQDTNVHENTKNYFKVA